MLGSYDVRLQIELEARSTSGVNNINSEELRSLRFCLPPLVEQRDIIKKAGALLQLADQLDARSAEATAHVHNLTPSILAKAFSGQLVPTEAELATHEGRDFETAEASLACIRLQQGIRSRSLEPAKPGRRKPLSREKRQTFTAK